MYAILFDIEKTKLTNVLLKEKHAAYDEIKMIMNEFNFHWVQGGLYISKNDQNNRESIDKVINRLSRIKWFVDSVRDIKAFKVDGWSDLTGIVKANSKSE